MMLRKREIRSVARADGFSLIEVSVAVLITITMLGVIGSVFTALAEGTSETQDTLVAQSQAARARLEITNDLQLTDTLGEDKLGEPYFAISNVDGGTNNAATFRTVVGYQPGGTDGMELVFSTPAQYMVQGNTLVRTRDGTTIVVAHHVSTVQFELTPTGVILVSLRVIVDPADPDSDIVSDFRIAPRNMLQF